MKITMRKTWTIQEDELLISAIQTDLGSIRWDEVTKHLQSLGMNRNSKQISSRWYYNLAPNINKSTWTRSESLNLLKMYKTHGCQWKRIALEFEGRTDYSIKNHFFSLIRRLLRLVAKTVKEDFTVSSTKLINFLKPKVLINFLLSTLVVDSGELGNPLELPMMDFIIKCLQVDKETTKNQISVLEYSIYKACVQQLVVLSTEYKNTPQRKESDKYRENSAIGKGMDTKQRYKKCKLVHSEIKEGESKKKDHTLIHILPTDTGIKHLNQSTEEKLTNSYEYGNPITQFTTPITIENQAQFFLPNSVQCLGTLFKNQIENLIKHLNFKIHDSNYTYEFFMMIMNQLSLACNETKEAIRASGDDSTDVKAILAVFRDHMFQLENLKLEVLSKHKLSNTLLQNQTQADNSVVETTNETNNTTESSLKDLNQTKNQNTATSVSEEHHDIDSLNIESDEENLKFFKGFDEHSHYFHNFKLTDSICILEDSKLDENEPFDQNSLLQKSFFENVAAYEFDNQKKNSIVKPLAENPDGVIIDKYRFWL